MFGLFKSILTKVGLVHADAPAAAPAPAVVPEAPAPEVVTAPAAVEAAPVVESTPPAAEDGMDVDAIPAADEEAAPEPEPEPEPEEEAPVEEAAPEPAPAPEPVDVVALMDGKAAASKEKGLDWRHSIVDLLKLLDLDSSLHARQGLAQELGYTGSTAGAHSAEMNMWLIKEVLKRLGENGGNIPANLTH